jgi:hypothetical protein
MKSLFCAAALVLLPTGVFAADLYSAPIESYAEGPAHVGVTMLLEGYGGYNWIDTNDTAGDDEEDTDFALFGGWAAFNIPLNGGYGVQLEAFGEGTTSDNADDDEGQYLWSAGGGAHAYWRDPARGLIGVFGAGYYGEVGEEDDDKDWGFAAGVEAQAYVNMSTLYGQIGYLTFPEATEEDVDFPRNTFFLRGVARHFLTENTKLEAEFGGATGTLDGDDETDFYLVNWAAEVEQGLGWTGMNLSLFARYEGIYADEVDEDDHSLDSTVKVGLRGRFGGAGESLYANDRNGVGLDLPDAGRWAGVLGGPVE